MFVIAVEASALNGVSIKQASLSLDVRVLECQPPFSFHHAVCSVSVFCERLMWSLQVVLHVQGIHALIEPWFAR